MMRDRVKVVFIVALVLYCSLNLYGGDFISLIEVEDEVISPPVAEYMIQGIKRCNEDLSCKLVIIQLDTPGGLDSSMRDIVKTIMNSSVPVVVYIYPEGARAASAGAIITISAHIAVMAPATNIGAAHPVTIGLGSGNNKDSKKEDPMMKKIIKDMVAYVKSIAKKRERNEKLVEEMVVEASSFTSEQAFKEGLVNFIAKDLKELLKKIESKEVETERGKVVLKGVYGLRIKKVKQGLRFKILKILGNPTIAYLLLILGIAGIYFELSNPGAVFPGVIGGISIVLAFFGLKMLPVNYAGIALIILGLIFFILELKVTSYGMLTIAAIISLFLGSVMLFKDAPYYMSLSYSVIIPVVGVASLFFVVIIYLVVKAMRKRVTTGSEGIIGEVGEVKEWINSYGKVFVHGELWNAKSNLELKKGERVKVKGIEGLILEVEKVKDGLEGSEEGEKN